MRLNDDGFKPARMKDIHPKCDPVVRECFRKLIKIAGGKPLDKKVSVKLMGFHATLNRNQVQIWTRPTECELWRERAEKVLKFASGR